MRNTGSYDNSFEQVDCILEIRLCTEVWAKIKHVALMRRSSYSWVVRHAIFRLIKRNNTKKHIGDIQNLILTLDCDDGYTLNKKVLERRHGALKKHRHRLCLYGEDELFIRLHAAQLKCTMTHLVRLALELYLDSMVVTYSKRKLSRYLESSWYWLGIKLYGVVEFHNTEVSNMRFLFQRFHKLEYW